MFDTLRWLLSGKPVHALHISKSGGTAFRAALKPYERRGFRRIIRLHGHEESFEGVLRNDPGAKVFFIVRDPVARFVSGFNSRLRKGQPRMYTEWEPGEQMAFEIFKTPNELAEALSSESPATRRDAEWAIRMINHTRWNLNFWLHGAEFLERNRENILYIATTETLNEDFDVVKRLMNLPSSASMPDTDRDRHATPSGFSKHLSEEGLRNIRKHYAADYETYAWCLKFREEFDLK